jgi:hypothetical protein
VVGRQAPAGGSTGDDDESESDSMLTKHTAMFDVRPATLSDEVEVMNIMFSTDEVPSGPPQTPLFAVDLTDAHIDASEFPEFPQLMSGNEHD